MSHELIIALITLGDPGRLTGGYLYHRRMAELAPAHGARVAFLSYPQRPFLLPALATPSILHHARNVGARALVLDSIAAPFLGAWPVLPEPPVPLLGMLHQPPGGIDFGPLRTALRAPLDRHAYRHARLLMVASDALADQLADEGMSPSRLRVVPPGRDVAAAIGPPPDNPRRGRHAAFLCVGNWVERKGILDLLDAFARLPDDAATLHLVGSQEPEPRYAARVHARLAQPDLAGRVVVHGPLSVGEVAAWYQAADAFVLPSLREPYGTVYGEAMAFGLPVAGWRAGNLPYLAEDEKEGLILEAGDLQGLTRALHRLAYDADLRRRLGEAAARRAATRPTWEESAALFFNTIKEVAEQREYSPSPSMGEGVGG